MFRAMQKLFECAGAIFDPSAAAVWRAFPERCDADAGVFSQNYRYDTLIG
jgi:hypothetical protein